MRFPTPSSGSPSSMFSAQFHRSDKVELAWPHGPVGDFKPAIDDGEPFAQLVLRHRQRWVGEKRIPAHEGVEPLVAEETRQRFHLVGRSIERSERLTLL